MLSSLKEKAQKASAAASAAMKQGVEAAKGAMSSEAQAKVSPQSLQQLCAMGFSRPAGEAALARVGGEDVEAAAAILCQQGGGAEPAGAPGGDAEARSALLTSGGASTDPPLSPGQWVEVHSLRPGTAAARMNGKVGQIISYSAEEQRYLVDFAGEPRLLRFENIREASAATKAKAQVQLSLSSAKESMSDAKRRAEAFFARSSTSKSASSAQAGGEANWSGGRVLGSTVETPADPSARRAALEAAERRLAEARARNTGTMEDYRRWQRENMEQARATRQRQPRGGRVDTVVIGEPVPPRQPADVEGEDADLQRALEASLAEAAPAGAPASAGASPSGPDASEEDVQLQKALAASLAPAGAPADAPADRLAACAAAAAEEKAEEGPPENDAFFQDPELFELQLQQAMAEEELQLQRVLADSIAAEREALESACAEAGSDLDAETVALAGAQSAEDLARELEARRQQEEHLREEQSALQDKLLQLKTEVAKRDLVDGDGVAEEAAAGGDATASPAGQASAKEEQAEGAEASQADGKTDDAASGSEQAPAPQEAAATTGEDAVGAPPASAAAQEQEQQSEAAQADRRTDAEAEGKADDAASGEPTQADKPAAVAPAPQEPAPAADAEAAAAPAAADAEDHRPLEQAEAPQADSKVEEAQGAAPADSKAAGDDVTQDAAATAAPFAPPPRTASEDAPAALPAEGREAE